MFTSRITKPKDNSATGDSETQSQDRKEDLLRKEIFETLRENTTLRKPQHWREQFERLAFIRSEGAKISQAIQSLNTLLGEELIISIYPPGKMDRETSRQIHRIQESVELSDDEKISKDKVSGYMEADTPDAIRKKSEDKEFWYITLRDVKNRYYGYYAHQIVEGKHIRAVDKGLSHALAEQNLFNILEDLPKVGLNHEISISIPNDNSAPKLLQAIKPSISALFNVLALAIEYEEDVTVCLGRCRSWNKAINSHLDAGWEQLNPSAFSYCEEIPIPTYGQESLELDTIVWNTPTERHLDTAITFLGLNPSNPLKDKVTQLIIKPPA